MHREPTDHVHQRQGIQIHQREKEGIRILDLQGRLTIGDPEGTVRAAITALADTGTVNIILNLAGITEMDDDGAGALVLCYARVAESNGALKLLTLPAHLSLMILTKLDTVMEVFSDEMDAINSFFPDRATRRYDILDWVEEQEDRARRSASQADDAPKPDGISTTILKQIR